MRNGTKILVVDDTPANLEVMTEMLSSVGYEVATAISGERALKRLKTYVPDLILLDIQMPGMDGFQICQAIKNDPKTANIPIIFITALSDIGHIVRGFSLGGVDYISKPFQQLELLTRVKTHLQLKFLTQDLEKQVAERTSELQHALEELHQSKLQLIQQEKMSALGNLVAGIAHEINNPIGFLNGSVNNAQEYIQNLLNHLKLYQSYCPDSPQPLQDNAHEIDLEFLCKDLPGLLESMRNAINRISKISSNLRTFARADTEYKVSADLHEGIDSTLLILQYRLSANQYRPAISVIKEYESLPEVICFPSQINQVFMNILANAIDMFDEMAQEQSFSELEANPQQITIRTTADSNQVNIYIRDNGKGMGEAVKAKIFDHLFTTKSIGKGTGLGLTISRQIVLENHGGSLNVQSEPGQGTEFCISLPLVQVKR